MDKEARRAAAVEVDAIGITVDKEARRAAAEPFEDEGTRSAVSASSWTRIYATICRRLVRCLGTVHSPWPSSAAQQQLIHMWREQL